eukprot:SAG22_NODE_573_length_8999_cov_9.592921_7_plen_117_part_00
MSRPSVAAAGSLLPSPSLREVYSCVISLGQMPAALGKELRDSEFAHLDPDVVRLNHGSYGAAPGIVLSAQTALRDQQNANPGALALTPQRGAPHPDGGSDTPAAPGHWQKPTGRSP